MNLTYKQILKSKDYLPFYVYDYETIKTQILKLKNGLPTNVKVFYSVKASPNIAILRIMKNFGFGVEILSLGEMLASEKAGFKSDEMIFGGSTRSDLELTLLTNKDVGLISLESLFEIQRLNKIAKNFSRKIKVLLRFKPDERCKYGNSLNDLEKILKNFHVKFSFLTLQGIHEYIQSRIYDAEISIKYLNHFFSILLHLEKKFNLKFEIIDIGGGFGSTDAKELDISVFCRGLSSLLKKCGFEKRKIILELGRYLVGRSGFYITRIIECRKQKGINYLIAEGIVNNYYAVKLDKPSEYFWPVDNFKMEIIGRRLTTKNLHPTIVCGQMSSMADIVGRNNKSYFPLPEAKPNDLLVIKDVGAYGLTWAHSLVGTRPIAAEFLLIDNKLELIRDKGEIGDFLKNQRIPNLLK